MPLFEISRKPDPMISGRILSLEILITYVMYLCFIFILVWWRFLPQMEVASEETRALLEEGGGAGTLHIIHGEYVPEIRIALLISFVCYGIMDGIIIFTLWHSDVKKERDETGIMITRSYSVLRGFSAFIAVMLTIAILVGTDPEFYLALLFISIPIFSIVSLLYFYYFRTHFSRTKDAHMVLLKAHEDSGP